MALRLTQLLTEMSTRNISWGKGGRCVGLTTLSPSCADCLKIWGASTSWKLQGLSRPVMRLFYLSKQKDSLNYVVLFLTPQHSATKPFFFYCSHS
jgi:hypothetical protein